MITHNNTGATMSTWLKLDDDVPATVVLRAIRALGYLYSDMRTRGYFRIHSGPELTEAVVQPVPRRLNPVRVPDELGIES